MATKQKKQSSTPSLSELRYLKCVSCTKKIAVYADEVPRKLIGDEVLRKCSKCKRGVMVVTTPPSEARSPRALKGDERPLKRGAKRGARNRV